MPQQQHTATDFRDAGYWYSTMSRAQLIFALDRATVLFVQLMECSEILQQQREIAAGESHNSNGKEI